VGRTGARSRPGEEPTWRPFLAPIEHQNIDIDQNIFPAGILGKIAFLITINALAVACATKINNSVDY
jgi:hypothetical protein